MGRRKKGRDVSGWLIVDKPEGVTSTQVVGRARWALDAAKAGHAGTLDPLATGLVAVAFGEATKTVPVAQEGVKTYDFTVEWGRATTTDDREGEICATSPRRPTRAEIEAALPLFTGDIMQIPPAFSAIKVAGRRAYDLARGGEAPDLEPRPIRVESLTLTAAPDADAARFRMVCGKGGYVRSIGRDLGEALGTVAHVAALRRIASGGFSLAGAIPFAALEALRGDAEADAMLAPVEAGLAGLPVLEIGEAAAARLAHGDASAIAPGAAGGAARFWLSCGGRAVAICSRGGGDGDGGGGAARIDRVFRRG